MSDNETESASERGTANGSVDFDEFSAEMTGNGDDTQQQLQDVTIDNNNNGDANGSESGSESDEDDDSEDAAAAAGLSISEREILTLLAVDKKLASVLELAADALTALKVSEEGGDASKLGLDERASAFERSATEYYEALDDIQLTLRISISVIRKQRISPQILMDNPNSAILRGGPIGLGSLPKSANGHGLSKGARRMETKAWQDALVAFKKLLPPAQGQNGDGDAHMKQEDGSPNGTG